MKPKTNQLLQKVQLDFLQTKNKEYTIQLLLIQLTISLTITTGTFLNFNIHPPAKAISYLETSARKITIRPELQCSIARISAVLC